VRRQIPLALFLSGVALSACADKTLFIESNAHWSGEVDGIGAVAGSGEADYELNGEGDICWAIRKTTLAGTLRTYVKSENAFGLGSDIEHLETTSDPYGEVAGCMN
jgi:hypothetical protein